MYEYHVRYRGPLYIVNPYWLSPDVLSHQTTNTAVADVWSLGITIIELCENGLPPRYNINPMKAVLMIVKDPAPTFNPGTNVSNECRDFVTQCLNKSSQHRPTAAQLLKHVRSFLP